MSRIARVVLLAVLATAALALKAAPACSGTSNTLPVVTAAPVFLRSVPNGKLYKAGAGSDTFYVLHLWGTPYQQGFAQGQLFASQIAALYPLFIDWVNSQLPSNLPANLLPLIDQGVEFLLDLDFNATMPFTPQRYLEEMQGLADGSGFDLVKIHRYNMVPELTKAACTIVGANGPSSPSGLIQHLRALDFDATCPLKDYAMVTVYHGYAPGEPTVANVGWMVMIGSLTGISNTSIGIGEKVWDNHPSSYDKFAGEPWMFILRDVLMTSNMNQALAVIQNANRTCSIHVGIGDSTTNLFRGVEMAGEAFNVYNWSSLSWPGHPVLTGVMYWDKHEQPSGNYCLSQLLQTYYGNLTASSLALNVAAIGETGTMHAVTFDYGSKMGYIANARKSFETTGDLNAYNRQYTLVNFAQLFAVQQ